MSTEPDVKREASDELCQDILGLDAVARLVAGLAHDLNNHLAVILNYTYILPRHFEENSPVITHLEEMRVSGWAASKLVRQLLAFGRRNIDEPQVLDLSVAIDDMEALLRSMLGTGVELSLELDPKLWPVRVSLPQIDQVLLNLAANAREAIKGAGSVTVATANVTLKERDDEAALGVTLGRHVLCKISHSRPGQGAAEQPGETRLFSAESMSEALGQAALLIERAMEKAEGVILVNGNPGEAGSFRIYLPALSEDADDYLPPAGTIHRLGGLPQE